MGKLWWLGLHNEWLLSSDVLIKLVWLYMIWISKMLVLLTIEPGWKNRKNFADYSYERPVPLAKLTLKWSSKILFVNNLWMETSSHQWLIQNFLPYRVVGHTNQRKYLCTTSGSVNFISSHWIRLSKLQFFSLLQPGKLKKCKNYSGFWNKWGNFFKNFRNCAKRSKYTYVWAKAYSEWYCSHYDILWKTRSFRPELF